MRRSGNWSKIQSSSDDVGVFCKVVSNLILNRFLKTRTLYLIRRTRYTAKCEKSGKKYNRNFSKLFEIRVNINSALASPRYALSIEISNAEIHPGFQKISSDQKSPIGEIDNFKYRSVRSFLRKTNVIFVIRVVELVDSNLKNFKNLKSEFSLQIYSNPKLGYCRSAVEMFLGPENHPESFLQNN